MKNRIKRLEKMVEYMSQNREVLSRDKICKELGVSKVTLRRYMQSLEDWGYEFAEAEDCLSVKRFGHLCDTTIFSKGDYISFCILMTIYNNNPCSRVKLNGNFCKDNKEIAASSISMSERNLDLHLNRLIELGYIEKYKEGSAVFFRTTDSISMPENIPFDKALSVFNYLNLNKAGLPFKNDVENILDKLAGAMTNYIRKSQDDYEDLKIAFEVFPDCLETEEDDSLDILAKELEKYCSKRTILVVRMKSGSILRIYPFCVVYNKNSYAWYLAGRFTSNHEGYDLIKLDNIVIYTENSENIKYSDEELTELRENAKREVQESFAVGLEETVNVKVLFENDRTILKELKLKFSNTQSTYFTLPDGRICLNAKVIGAMDFMAWIRRFGSRACIIKPAALRERHLKDAERALDMYREYEKQEV